MTSNPDEFTLGNSGADITLVHLIFGEISFEEVERADAEENRKT